MTDRGSKNVLIQKMTAMFSCAHRACMLVYSTAACNTCQPMTSAERMRKPQLQSTDLWPETQFSKRAVTFLEMMDLGPSFPVRGYSCIHSDTSHAPCYSCMLYEYEYDVQQSCFDMHRTHRFMQLRFVESWYRYRYRI